jgi:hypothetical protein
MKGITDFDTKSTVHTAKYGTVETWHDSFSSPEKIISNNKTIRNEIKNLQTLSSPVDDAVLSVFTNEDNQSYYALKTFAKMYAYMNITHCDDCFQNKCEHVFKKALKIVAEQLKTEGFVHLKVPHMRGHKISYHYSSNGGEANEVKEYFIYFTEDKQGEIYMKFGNLIYSEYYVKIDGEYVVNTNFTEEFYNQNKLLQGYKYYSYKNGMLSDFNSEAAMKTHLVVAHWENGELMFDKEQPTIIGYAPAITDEALKYGEQELYNKIIMLSSSGAKRTPRMVLWANKTGTETYMFNGLKASEKYETYVNKNIDILV